MSTEPAASGTAQSTHSASREAAPHAAQARRNRGYPLNSRDRRVQPFPTSDGPTLPEIGDDVSVAVSTDWESIMNLAIGQIDRMTVARPDVHTVLHLGDLRLDPYRRNPAGAGRYLRRLDDALHATGLRRLLVTPWNHDDWSRLTSWWTTHHLPAYRLASRIWFLRPGTRFTVAGRSILSFGGASAFDRAHQPWWDESMPDADLSQRVSAAGPCDVLLTHEAVDSGICAVRRVLDGPARWPTAELRDSARSRLIVGCDPGVRSAG